MTNITNHVAKKYFNIEYISNASAAVHWIAKNSCRWSWNINYYISSTKGATLTGIRTVSAWRRYTINSEREPSCIRGVNKIFSGEYDFYSDRYEQIGVGEDDPMLAAALMRLDMQAHPWDLSYKTHPGAKDLPAVVWVVDSSFGGFKAVEMGWTEGVSFGAKPDKWLQKYVIFFL